MDIDAFRCMRQGKAIVPLTTADIGHMAPVDIKRRGSEKALLMLHGFTSTPAVFRLFLPHLKQYDRIIVPLLPGHGDSLAAFAQITAHDWLQAVETQCEQLMEEYRQVDVLGLSLGGILACHLVKRFDLNHLYLLAPALDLRINPKYTLKLARTLHFLGFRDLRSKAGNIHQPGQCEISYKKIPLPILIEVVSLIEDFTFQIPNCPCDIFIGRYDEVVDSHKIDARFSPHVGMQVHWLDNSAHVLPLDGDSDTILSCINSR